MNWAQSIALRVSLAFALLVTLVLIALGLYLGRATDAHMAELDTHELHGKLMLVQHQASRHASAREFEQSLGDVLVGSHGVQIVITGDRGLGISIPMGPLTAPLPASPANPYSLQTLQIEGDRVRLLETRFTTPWGENLRVIAARQIAHHTDFLERLQRDFWIAVVACALLIIVFGSLIARRGLAPLRDFSQVAGGISAGALEQRLPEAGQPAELLGLVRAFNGMLDRLEQSFRQLSEYAADVAHELRTPIHTLRMQTEVTLSRERDADAYRDALSSALEEYERLSRIISDMLFLAKADQGLIVPNRGPIALDVLLERLVDYYSLLADPRQIHWQPSSITLSGDQLMLERAIGNLLLNAIQHTPEDGEIRIETQVDRDSLRIGIFNSGTPIPTERIPALFHRFQRFDAGHEGHGLGLAISLSIVRAHGGHIRVQPEPDGTRFELVLPT